MGRGANHLDGKGRPWAPYAFALPALLVVGAASAAPAPTTSPEETAAASAEPGSTADEPGTPADEATTRATEAYRRGVGFAKEQQWGDALAAFEEAASAKDSPTVQYNIAYCLRALGRYVAAREVTRRVLADPKGLAPTLVEDAQYYLKEFDALVVDLDVTLDPPSARLTVDGRPLIPAEGKDQYLADPSSREKGAPLGKRQFKLLLDPGSHIVKATRAGHQDVVLPKSYKPGEKAKLDLRLDVLPATVSVKSVPEQAIVRVDDREVGLTPIEVERPAGHYSLELALDGYETHSAALDLRAGERADLTAELVPYETPLYEEWWFWTGAIAILGGGVVLTYFLARPDPETPPYDGGTTGWVVSPQAIEF